MENTHFRLSTAGQLAQRFRSEDRQDLVEEGEGLEQIDKNLMPYVFEVRALIGRINEIKGRKQQIDTVQEANLPALIFGSDGVDFSDLFDDDLIARYLESKDPNYSKQQEINEVVGRLRELLSNKNILKAYQDYFKIIIEKYHRMRKMKTAYEKGELVKRDGTGKKKSMKLNVDDKTFAGQQFVTILRDLMSDAALEIQNIHNRVSSEGRDYNRSDEQVLERLYNLIKQSDTTIDELKAKDYRIAQALRIEEIIRDATIVKKWTPRKTVRGLKRQKYVETESRLKMIRGNHDASKYILSCLRNGDNVEFTGPTGTGKTQIAIYAAKLFCDGREPVVLSGGPGVYASTFYGSAAGQGKRNPGTAIQAIENDTVLIIDEDNRIDPKQLAEIKFLLGLKPGDLFFHRDTGQMYTIPPHFRVIVTRNEKGAHHKDRSELPADYRREFTFGSFEVPYYTPQEMYDRFLIPKLARKDGSMDLSIDEVGGKIGTDQTSPLLELVLAAEEIQKEYKSVHLKNSVFESGYLIGLFNQWKEVKYAKDKQGARIKFLTYIEAKLLEFIKRAGLGNPDRKILIQILYRHGFFHGWKREVFQTEDEGLVYVNDADFTSLTTSVTKDIFANARLEITTQKHLEPSEVAMLDPFNKRDIQITEHPLKSKIEEFYNKYVEFCEGQKPRVFPVVFTPDDDFESKKVRITNQLIEQMELKQTTVLWLHVADLINTLKDAQAASLEELLEAATQLIVGFNDRLAALATIYKESRTYTSKYKDYERQVLALTRDTSLPALTPATFRRPSDFISDIANALNDLIPYIERYGHKYEAMPRQDPALKNVAKVDLIKFNKIPEILKDPARAINLQHFKDILDGTSGFARLIFDLNKNKFKQ